MSSTTTYHLHLRINDKSRLTAKCGRQSKEHEPADKKRTPQVNHRPTLHIVLEIMEYLIHCNIQPREMCEQSTVMQ